MASDLWAELDSLDESIARMRINGEDYGEVGSPRYASALEWLASKDRARAESATAKRDTREEETLSIAREANTIARSASFAATAAASAASDANDIARFNRRISITATIIAALAMIIAIFK